MKKTFRHNKFSAVFTDEDGYFSLTGEVDGGSGAVGKEIATIDPRFQILDDMHLCDCITGVPMHALENAFYHYKKSNYKVIELEKYWKVKLTEGQKLRLKITIDNIQRNDKTRETQLKDMTSFIMNEIKPIWLNRVKQVYALVESIPSDLTEGGEFNPDDFDEPEKVRALAMYLDVDPSIVKEQDSNCFEAIVKGQDSNCFEAIGQGFRVLTDSEADEAWDESLDSYIDECVLHEIPDHLQSYFDRKAFKRDAEIDGRGHSLSSYDGCEYKSEDPETKEIFYIYRTN